MPNAHQMFLLGEAYSFHLVFDERVHREATCLLLPHQAKHVPVCLEGAGGTQSCAALTERPVEKVMKDLDGECFQGCERILMGIMTLFA